MAAALIQVHGQGTTYSLDEGESVVIGRSPDAEAMIVVGPTDPKISRSHVELRLVGGRVAVRRLSEKQAVYIYSGPGRPRDLRARDDEMILAGTFEVRLRRTPESAGRDAMYRIHVQAPQPGPDPLPDSPFSPVTSISTSSAPDLKPRQRRLLAAYCDPILEGSTRTIEVHIATHKQVAARLAYSAETVRKEMADLRERMSREKHFPMKSSLQAFCEWAVETRLVTEEDRSLLPPLPPPA